jgi:hypothetical protein
MLGDEKTFEVVNIAEEEYLVAPMIERYTVGEDGIYLLELFYFIFWFADLFTLA